MSRRSKNRQNNTPRQFETQPGTSAVPSVFGTIHQAFSAEASRVEARGARERELLKKVGEAARAFAWGMQTRTDAKPDTVHFSEWGNVPRPILGGSKPGIVSSTRQLWVLDNQPPIRERRDVTESSDLEGRKSYHDIFPWLAITPVTGELVTLLSGSDIFPPTQPTYDRKAHTAPRSADLDDVVCAMGYESNPLVGERNIPVERVYQDFENALNERIARAAREAARERRG